MSLFVKNFKSIFELKLYFSIFFAACKCSYNTRAYISVNIKPRENFLSVFEMYYNLFKNICE